MIPQDFINDLNQRIDIVDVVGKHVDLKKAGNEYKGLCPFHNEKTPSFTVNPAKQFYHCFGCHEGGNAINFLMKKEGKSFYDVVDDLATSVGLKVPGKKAGNHRRRSAGPGTNEYDLIARVCDSYQEHLLGKQPYAAAAAYLKERGISRKTAETFGLGYAPDTWDYLLRMFGQSATERRRLEDAGLIARKDDDSGYFYDRFRGRLMFPIIDSRNRVVGFGGRAIGDQIPKYLNSPTTAMFKKSQELFGLFQAMPGIDSTGQVLIVEGYTDVLSLHQNGVTNAVASCGTAVTAEHAERLFKLADEVIFSFDGDDAGRRAAVKASQALLPVMADGKMASIVFVPDGHDPDSIIRSDPKWYEQHGLHARIPVLEFLLNGIESECDMNRLDGRARYNVRAAEVIAQLPRNGLLRHIVSDYCVSKTGADPLVTEELRPCPEKQAQ